MDRVFRLYFQPIRRSYLRRCSRPLMLYVIALALYLYFYLHYRLPPIFDSGEADIYCGKYRPPYWISTSYFHPKANLQNGTLLGQSHVDLKQSKMGNRHYGGVACQEIPCATKILDSITLTYKQFEIPEPNFIDSRHREVFAQNLANVNGGDDMMGKRPKGKLKGAIKMLRNGIISKRCDCGWQSHEYLFWMWPEHKYNIQSHHNVLCPLLVPAGEHFQHFIDGVLPKIMQVLPVLKSIPSAKILLFMPESPLVYDILAKLNLTQRLVFYHKGVYSADYVIDTCITPPLHPELWQRARKAIGVSTGTRSAADSRIILLWRGGSQKNFGREIRNIEAVVEYLQKKFQSRFNLIDGSPSLEQSLDVFGEAKVIIGVHGGALYNAIFAPNGTHIIEVIPTDESGDIVPNWLSHNIFWHSSALLNQTYWRLPHVPLTPLGDVEIDIASLDQVLEIILSN